MALTRLLLEAGASPKSTTSTGHQPLHYACERKQNSSVIRLLVAKGADVEAVSLGDGSHKARTPLQITCTVQLNVESVQALLDLGAKINHRLEYSPLELAVLSKSPSIVTLLLENRADPHAKTAESGRPCILVYAAMFSDADGFLYHKDMVLKLLDFNADGSAQDVRGNNVFHYLAFYVWLEHDAKQPLCHWWREMFDELWRCGADPTMLNKDDKTVFSLAVKNLKAPLLSLLLDGSVGRQCHVNPYYLMKILANVKSTPFLQKAKNDTFDALYKYKERCSAQGDTSLFH